jgi:hypothetical protein
VLVLPYAFADSAVGAVIVHLPSLLDRLTGAGG